MNNVQSKLPVQEQFEKTENDRMYSGSEVARLWMKESSKHLHHWLHGYRRAKTGRGQRKEAKQHDIVLTTFESVFRLGIKLKTRANSPRNLTRNRRKVAIRGI
jgi:hypothetical protein